MTSKEFKEKFNLKEFSRGEIFKLKKIYFTGVPSIFSINGKQFIIDKVVEQCSFVKS